MMTETIMRKPARPAAGNTSNAPGHARPRPPRFASRKVFLRLPLSERRRILKAQALAARTYYANATEWREWDAADLTSTRNE